jgi:hypothetical protein
MSMQLVKWTCNNEYATCKMNGFVKIDLLELLVADPAEQS